MSDLGFAVLTAFLCLTCFIIGGVRGVTMVSDKIHKTNNIVITSADTEKVTTNSGLKIENKGFNVGDTLVIIKK